ncbi:MAG: glycosyltransferase family 4 protein [Acidimicrobiia bacterium]|jgi:glycosyltransferase involved in cell wall biosynthesis/ribosomal protein S18 acetylase RimI-like enzyme
MREKPDEVAFSVAHLTTVDMSLRFLLWPQLLAVVDAGGESFGISAPGPWVAELEDAGVHHLALQSSTRGFSLWADVRSAVELWRILRRTPLTILHTHNPKPGVYGRILGRLAGVPVVVNTLHGFYATKTDPMAKRLVVYGLEGLAARFSDAELHQNPEDLELAGRSGIVPHGRGRLLGNGIDLSRFDPSDKSGARARIRDEIGADDSDVVVGTVGRLVAEKGYLELFEAVERVGPGFVFVVVGPADLDKPDSLPAEVVERARSAGVRFLGMRTDMEDIYAGLDLFVLPSHREGFPRAAMEAAAMGLPVIATDIRGCRQVVRHGVNGLLVPVGEPDALAKAIETVGEDREVMAEMSAESHRIAREEFDERRVVDIVMSTYRETLEAKGLAHLMPAGMLDAPDVSPPREAKAEDAVALAGLHSDLITGGFLPRLGRRFMRLLYRGLLEWEGTRAYVVDDAGGAAGFVVGVVDVGAFYRWFLKRHWWRAGLAALPALLDPRNMWRAWESLRYGGQDDTGSIPSEVLSLGVAIRARGRGCSGVLLTTVLDRLADDGCSAVRVVVASQNAAAIAAYRKAGFVAHDTIEVHRGESSEVLAWHHS